jgi:hypothetical protein
VWRQADTRRPQTHKGFFKHFDSEVFMRLERAER